MQPKSEVFLTFKELPGEIKLSKDTLKPDQLYIDKFTFETHTHTHTHTHPDTKTHISLSSCSKPEQVN